MVKAIAIVANPKSANIRPAVHDVLDFLRRFHINILIDKRTSDIMGVNWHSTEDEIRKEADFVIAMGGDGTILGAARLIGAKETPILGIHMGRLGFITEHCYSEIKNAIQQAIDGKLSIHKRMRLECEIVKDGNVVYREHALNEITLNKGGIARVIDFEVRVGGDLVSLYRADGFIVSTPTGSTGYSLSAGGPIIDPDMELIILAPICSHSVDSRPVIVPADSLVNINLLEPRHDIYISQDGQVGRNLQAGESLQIKKTSFYTMLYYAPERSFYNHLRNKFGWGTPK
jgi:NAD+ kinase